MSLRPFPPPSLLSVRSFGRLGLTAAIRRDWGLHNVRRTAFHAAVNYYSRQLGITLCNAPVPLAWADRETGELIATPDAPADEYADGEEPAPPASPLERKESTEGREGKEG